MLKRANTGAEPADGPADQLGRRRAAVGGRAADVVDGGEAGGDVEAGALRLRDEEGGLGERFSAQGVRWSSAGENIGFSFAGDSDAAIVQAARVSYGAGTTSSGKVRLLYDSEAQLEGQHEFDVGGSVGGREFAGDVQHGGDFKKENIAVPAAAPPPPRPGGDRGRASGRHRAAPPG